MADFVTAKVEGADVLVQALRNVPRRVAGRALSQAVRKAMNPMRKAVRQAMPGHWKKLKRRVGISGIGRLAKRSLRGSRVGYSIHGFYARFLEHGTQHASARVFMVKAFRATADTVIRQLSAELWRAINDQVAKENARNPAKRGRGKRR